MYLKLETIERTTEDTEQEWRLEDHSVEDESEEARLRELARRGLIKIDPLTGEVIDESALASAKGAEICSCGYHTCGAIVHYGLPVATFKSDIEPIRSQSKRDKTARPMRQAWKSGQLSLPETEVE